jgi:hypothetical protein
MANGSSYSSFKPTYGYNRTAAPPAHVASGHGRPMPTTTYLCPKCNRQYQRISIAGHIHPEARASTAGIPVMSCFDCNAKRAIVLAK